MVLKQILPNVKDPRGKWAPNYEGPYVVKQAFFGGALILTNVEGQDLKYPVNTDLASKAHFQKAPRKQQPLEQGQVVGTPAQPMVHDEPSQRINS
ncbi:hypothetical protein CR513_08640, partial [Mucuna pruriens]